MTTTGAANSFRSAVVCESGVPCAWPAVGLWDWRSRNTQQASPLVEYCWPSPSDDWCNPCKLQLWWMKSALCCQSPDCGKCPQLVAYHVATKSAPLIETLIIAQLDGLIFPFDWSCTKNSFTNRRDVIGVVALMMG